MTKSFTPVLATGIHYVARDPTLPTRIKIKFRRTKKVNTNDKYRKERANKVWHFYIAVYSLNNIRFF